MKKRQIIIKEGAIRCLNKNDGNQNNGTSFTNIEFYASKNSSIKETNHNQVYFQPVDPHYEDALET